MLKRIGETILDYNKTIEEGEEISQKEKEAISLLDIERQDRITNSILIRYFPSTLVDMYENDDPKRFIDLYKHESVENEYCIWNRDMRDYFLNTIRGYIKPHIEELLTFIVKGFSHYKVPGNLPLFFNRFKKIIHYESLDKELKINKYYVRMWVKNANSLQMNTDELEVFYQNLLILIDKNIGNTFLNSSQQNFEEGVTNLIV